MHAICHRLVIGMLLVAVAGGPAWAQSEVQAKPAAVLQLQRALRDHDRAWLADHVRYPLRYHGRAVAVIRNRSDFLRNYDTIVSDRLRSAVLTQDPERVFENWQGLMVGDGSHNIWLRESGEGAGARYEIVTINDVR
jgi:hypothetical protein